MGMTTAQQRAKLEEIRDNILNDLATDSGPKFRIASYNVGNGASFQYSTRAGALAAVKEINAMIAQLPAAAGEAQSGHFQLGQVRPS